MTNRPWSRRSSHTASVVLLIPVTAQEVGGLGQDPPAEETPICVPAPARAARAHMAHERAGTPETLAHCDVFCVGFWHK